MMAVARTKQGRLREAVQAAIGGLPRQFWFLWAGMLINRAGSFVLPMLALYLSRERGFTDQQVGFIVGVYGAGAVLGNQLGGALTDRVGRRATLLLGLCSGAVAMVALGLARSPQSVTASTFALGLLGESYRPAMQAMVADLVPPQHRARAFGLTYWAINLGFATAAALAGLLAKVAFLLLFIGDAATTLAYAAVVLFFLRETRPASTPSQPALETLLVPFRDRTFLGFWLLSFATAAVFMQHIVSLPLAMQHDGLSAASFGRVIALNGLLVVLVQPIASPLLSRFPRSGVLAAGSAVIGLGFGLLAIADQVGWYALSVVIWTLGEIAVLPTAAAVVADLAPAHLRGTYQGAQNIAWGLAWAIGPVIGTQALASLGSGLWGTCLLMGLLVATGHLAISGSLRRRTGGPAVEPRGGQYESDISQALKSGLD